MGRSPLDPEEHLPRLVVYVHAVEGRVYGVGGVNST